MLHLQTRETKIIPIKRDVFKEDSTFSLFLTEHLSLYAKCQIKMYADTNVT